MHSHRQLFTSIVFPLLRETQTWTYALNHWGAMEAAHTLPHLSSDTNQHLFSYKKNSSPFDLLTISFTWLALSKLVWCWGVMKVKWGGKEEQIKKRNLNVAVIMPGLYVALYTLTRYMLETGKKTELKLCKDKHNKSRKIIHFVDWQRSGSFYFVSH